MAKGKKAKKAHDDSWENEMDNEPRPAELAPAEPPAEPSTTTTTTTTAGEENNDFSGAGGGLMAAIKKNRDNKKKKGKAGKAAEEPQKADEEADGGTPQVTVEAEAPTEANEVGEDDFGPAAKGKKGKAGDTEPAVDEGAADGDGRVKTKKEKEREKKEREKQRKKEQVRSFRPPLPPLPFYGVAVSW